MDPMKCPDDAARLYDDLRSFIRANDQQGVRRAIGELDRAGRPLAEVLAVVRSLSRTGERQKAKAVRSQPDDSEPCAPGLGASNFAPPCQVPTQAPLGSSSESSSNNNTAALKSVLGECPGNSAEIAAPQSAPRLISQSADVQSARSALVLADWVAGGAVGDSEESNRSSTCDLPNGARLFDQRGAEAAPAGSGYGTAQTGSADIGLSPVGRSAETMPLPLRRRFMPFWS
jgi:hypothetical protein